MPEFLTYTKVHTNEEAQELVKLFTAANIECIIEAERDPLDKVYAGDSLDPFIAVKIPHDYFEKANKVMQQQAQSQLDDINPDYYLFNFTNDELLDVLKDPNEWNYLDQALAKKLLAERKVDIPVNTVDLISAPAFTPYRLGTATLIVEYVASILFAFAGIFIGVFTLVAYKALKDGSKVKMYDHETRTNATIMLCIGVVRTFYYYIYLIV